MTSKISFVDVVKAIHDNAFVASPYPLVLSVENHCCPEQCIQVYTHISLSIFRDIVYTCFVCV